MYTHCPHCDTCFRVTTEQLKAARGSVRCGRCFGTFNALENLVDEPPPTEARAPAPAATAKPAPRSRPAPAVPVKTAATPEPITAAPLPAPPPAAPRTAAEEAPTPPAEAAPAIAAEPSPTPQPAPQPAHEAQLERSQQLVEEIQSGPHKPARNLFWLWSSLALVLTLLLIAQYAWFNLATLAQQPQWRPALEAMCSIAKCEVPLMKAPYMITLVERDIRNPIDNPDLLLVTARIINKAPHPQAYPLMELSLHDITGHVIASRRFTPDEYLSKEINQKQGMASQQVVDIRLELADPGKDAVGFEFEFF